MKMAKIAKITDAYVRHYRDNRQTTAYVEWVDASGVTGRTEGSVPWRPGHWVAYPASSFMYLGTHMTALFARANREGIPIRGETW